MSNLSKTNESKIPRKGALIALGIISIVLVAILGGVIAEYTLMTNDKNNTISTLNNQASQLNSTIANLQGQVASANSSISALTSELTNMTNKVTNLTSEVTNLTSEVTNLTSQLAAFLPNDSSTYFAISDLAGTYLTIGTAYNGSGSPPVSVLFNNLAFNWTPVGGDASNVRIFILGITYPEQTWWPNLTKNGTSTYTGTIELGSPVLIEKQDNGTYTFPILVDADQANGTITLNFNATMPGGNFIWVGQYVS